MKRFIVCLLVALLGLGCAMLEAADLVTNQYSDSVAAYKSANGAAGKTEFLVRLVNAGKVSSHGAFYEILRMAEEEDIPCFRDALRSAKSPAVLLDLGAYLDVLKVPFVEEAQKNPKMSELQAMQLQKKANDFIKPFKRNIEMLVPEIALAAKKNPQVLIEALKKAFVNEEATDSDITGPAIGIASMKEEGAVLVLKSISKDSEAKGALSYMTKALGPDMVIPALKQCENPASSREERETAGLVIFMLPDVEPVYDKVVEAYRHGRYFEPPKLKKGPDGKTVLTLEDAMEIATSWWGNDIKGKYEDVEGFVPYVAEKHLAKAEGQEKIIELLAHINFGEVAPYFMELDFAQLPEESLDALLHACYVSPSSRLIPNPGKKEYKIEKFKIYERVFKALGKDVRQEKKMIYSLPNYPLRNQVMFVKNNIGVLTEEEKTTIAFLCGSKDSLLHEPLSGEDRKVILDTLRQGASSDLLQTIDHVEKK